MNDAVESLAAAARITGITPATIRTWIAKQWLDPTPPWTREQLDMAMQASRQRARRGATSPHGTVSRYRAGCRCRTCDDAHNRDMKIRRDARRTALIEAGAPVLFDALVNGAEWKDALLEAGLGSTTVAWQRRHDPKFADAVDAALMEGRDPHLNHGTARGWQARCRCPECRAYHESSRGTRVFRRNNPPSPATHQRGHGHD